MHISKTKWSRFLYFEGAKFLFIVLLICLIIASVLGAYTPHLMGDLANNYDNNDDYYKSIYSLLILFIGAYLNRGLYQITVNKFVKLLVQHVRSNIYEKWLLSYDVQTHKDHVREKYPQGEVIARIISDTQSIRELITSGTFGIFIDLFFVISCLVSFISVNLISGFTLVITEVIAASLLLYGSKYMRTVFMRVRNARAQVFKTVANVVGGVKEAYYTEHGRYASKKGAIVFDDFLSKQLKSNFWDVSYYSLAESLYPLLLALVVVIFPYSNITEAAVIFIIVDLIQRSINPVKDIAGKVANVQRAMTGVIRVDEFLNDLDSSPSAHMEMEIKPVDFKKMEVHIPFYEYPKRGSKEQSFAISDVKFSGKRGELIGIAGISGCGKSTVLNVLAGNIIPKEVNIELYCGEHKEDHIVYTGQDFNKDLSFREQVGIVSQDSHIFSESLMFNISMQQDHTQEFDDFWLWVCEKVPYLQNWGLKPDDILDQNTLSMGQKQLIAAIRSSYLKKTVVLFDEISSGLDSELEEALREMVLLVQEFSLTIIVAHRLETIIGADKIIVMDQGKVSAIDKHENLIKTSEIYKEFMAELSHSH
jgi:ATP-binding cassette subfamily B protein